MNTAKPSIPSSNGGAADDLIEELARLMAQGAQENSATAPPAAGNTPPSAKPELAVANSPARNPFRPTQPSHQNIAPAGKPALKLESEATSKQPAAPGSIEPRSKGPGFSLGAGRDPADKPISAKPMPAKPVSALSASDRIAPEVKSTAPSDPIADLIRAQSAPEKDAGTGAEATNGNDGGAEPQAVASQEADNQAVASQAAANGETAAEPRHGGGSDEKVSSQRGNLQRGDLQRGDQFRIPPVFGLSGKPGKTGQTTAPVSIPVAPVSPSVAKRAGFIPTPAKTSDGTSSGGSDALDEIESLIGNAVRVDFSDDPDPAEPKSSEPGTAKSSAQDKKETPSQEPPKDKIDSAEDAILQAMAAIGKSAQENQEHQEKQEKRERRERRDRLENSVKPPVESDLPDIFAADGSSHEQTENDDPVAPDQRIDAGKTSGGRASRFLVPLGAGVVLIGAILGGYWVLTSGVDNADAPVLVADNTPSKQAPAPGQESSGGQSAQFPDVANSSANANAAADANANANTNANANANERLVSRDQSTDVIGNEIRRVITADTTETGLANRRVRTVTVRPDGTIINGDGAVAGGQALPVTRPNVPQLPANALNPELTNTSVAALPEPLSLNNASNPDLTSNVASSGIIAPIPRPRPANRAALASTNNTQNSATNNSGTLDLIAGTTSAAPTPPAPIASTAPTSAPSTTLSNPTAWVQMASRRSQDAATQSAASLQTKYASLLGGVKLEVKRIDLGERGVFYRVMLPAATLKEASSVCDAIKNAGGDCFTRNN